MRRRRLIAALAATFLPPPPAFAQARPPMIRVGLVGALSRRAPQYVTFENRMSELGYEEGKNFAFEFVQAKSGEDYRSAFAELAGRNVDIFISVGNEVALRAALAAAGTRPIILDAFDFDPFEKGYVASLARPGGNITGLFVRQIELAVSGSSSRVRRCPRHTLWAFGGTAYRAIRPRPPLP